MDADQVRPPDATVDGAADEADQLRLLDELRWHVVRVDGQRSDMWMRASSLLSANGLVVAGAAVLLTLGPDPQDGVRQVLGILPLVCSLLSVHQAAGVVTRAWGGGSAFAGEAARLPLLYAMHQNADIVDGDFRAFTERVRARSVADQVDDSLLEIWRVCLLHRQRDVLLRRAVALFVLSVPLLIVSAVVAVVPLP
jgi:hypothetical protein